MSKEQRRLQRQGTQNAAEPSERSLAGGWVLLRTGGGVVTTLVFSEHWEAIDSYYFFKDLFVCLFLAELGHPLPCVGFPS